MTYLIQIIVFLITFLYVSSSIFNGFEPSASRPNIIIINIDDLGWPEAGFMGSQYYETPIYLEGGNTETQNTIFSICPGSVIRLGDWKLIQYFENDDLESCNLKSDPREKSNLFKSNSEKTKELPNLFVNWWKTTQAPIPTTLNPNSI